jgi:formylglycine-generating enzyme required for sulfatase activity
MNRVLICFVALFFTCNAFADRGIRIQGKSMAERRVALIIGNASYQSSPLKNPVNDADDIAKALSQLGFQVTLGKNLNRKEMRSVIREFGKNLRQGGVGLFYFAGHGMQVEGRNYLIPIGADITAEFEISDEAVDAGLILKNMEAAGNSMNMVFMDACRDNPFARSFRSSQKGLAQMDAPSGSLIVYATAPGSVAADGDGRNGVFTQNLLANLNTPGLPVAQMMMKVRVGVERETDGKQMPWESSSLKGDFYFVPGTPMRTTPPVATDTPAPSAKEETALDSILREAEEKKLEAALAKRNAELNAEQRNQEIESYFAKLEDVDKMKESALSSESKVEAWNEFIHQYPKDNPKFELATKRLQHWQEMASLPVEERNKAPKGMIKIPGGEYLAGANPSIGFIECQKYFTSSCERGWNSHEGPEHSVLIDDFFMDQYEVTQADYERVMGRNPSYFKGENRPVENGENRPVERVLWHEAQAYCEKVGKRLPTEAEWEKAMRGGTTTTYYWGDEYDSAYGLGLNDSGGMTQPVGQKKPNPFGLYDMAANVEEWTADWYDANSYQNVPDANPKGPSNGKKKVLRGGSWIDYPHEMRSARRSWENPKSHFAYIGFRCAR